MEPTLSNLPPHSYRHPHQIIHSEHYLGIIFALIMINFIFVGYLALQYNLLYAKLEKLVSLPSGTPISTPQITIVPSVSPSPEVSPSIVDNPKAATVDITLYQQTEYNAKNEAIDKVKFVAPFPKGTRTTYTSPAYTLIALQNSTYRLVANKTSTGPCPLIPDETECTYLDESLGNIPIFRVWKDNKGTFMLNPQSIAIGNYYISNLVITKEKPNTVFSTEEVTQWKEILRSIKLISLL